MVRAFFSNSLMGRPCNQESTPDCWSGNFQTIRPLPTHYQNKRWRRMLPLLEQAFAWLYVHCYLFRDCFIVPEYCFSLCRNVSLMLALLPGAHDILDTEIKSLRQETLSLKFQWTGSECRSIAINLFHIYQNNPSAFLLSVLQNPETPCICTLVNSNTVLSNISLFSVPSTECETIPLGFAL